MDAKSALGRVTSALHVGGYEATRVAAMAGLCQELAAGIETGENQNEEPGLRSDGKREEEEELDQNDGDHQKEQ
jgi:hypothetical protein